ncbi:hypothetical protein CSAL01_11833 [Colletotrichum salicis]|uniref:Uncharacterized protein n=1 Tax=Colletotrichum salicis TaxID=1209931 RepID=A0A135V0I0_9PEZI|nr:hypothetical protein CSAL01_11833 [Colletotrichum salicis]
MLFMASKFTPPHPSDPFPVPLGCSRVSHLPSRDSKVWCVRFSQSVIPSLIAGLGSLVALGPGPSRLAVAVVAAAPYRRTRQRRRTYHGTSHTSGLPRGDYSFSPPVPPEPPLPGSERGSGG